MEDGQYFEHPLENIEDIETFTEAVDRKRLTRSLSAERPYTYWTLEYYDQTNGIRGGGGLGILAADTRRVAEQMNVPLTLVTPFYPSEFHQVRNADGSYADKCVAVDYRNFDFRLVDSVFIKCCGNLCKLDVIEKKLGSTRILCVTEPGFRELYSGMSGSDHRLYQEVALGFGGYAALKLIGLKPAVMQLNEVATFFAALARLDELASNGMDFYEAMVYTRKHTLYTNHTLVQAAEAEFGVEQFERFVLPNLRSKAVKKWLMDKFVDGRLKLSSVTIEIAELRSGVSKLHARVANYRDIAGNKVKFRAVTNGIDMKQWVMPEVLTFYRECGIIDSMGRPTSNFGEALEKLEAGDIRRLKARGREILNEALIDYPDQNGKILHFEAEDFIFDFKRRFVDYKRPEMPFTDLERLRAVLEPRGAHYILTGRVHTGDENMMGKLRSILTRVAADDYLSTHVHYLADYDEYLALALSCGANAAINLPIVGLEACGTSWEKDVANLQILISTNDGGVADVPAKYHLDVAGTDFEGELDAVYTQMERAIEISESDFDLETTIREQLYGYLPVISGARMMQEYLDYLFPE